MGIVAARTLDEKQYDEYLQKYLSMVLHHEEIQLMTNIAKRIRSRLDANDQSDEQEKKND